MSGFLFEEAFIIILLDLARNKSINKKITDLPLFNVSLI